WLPTKWNHWLQLVLHLAGPGHWRAIQADFRHLARALRLREAATDRPALGTLFLDGSINALRDLFGHPRSNLPPAGTLRLHYSIGGDTEPTGLPPRFLRRWFNRIAPVLASAAGRVYRNDDTPLVEKLPKTVNLLLRQINLLDLLAGAGFALAAGICGGTLAAM